MFIMASLLVLGQICAMIKICDFFFLAVLKHYIGILNNLSVLYLGS